MQVKPSVKKYRPEHTLLVPAHYEKLMNSREMANGFDLSFFRTAGSGGDTMNAGLEAKLNSFLESRGCKYPLSQGYGMSEVSSAASCCCNGNFKSLSVGYPLLTTTMGIFKPGTTEELGYGQEGEICISGPSVMLGYLNNQSETDNVIKTHPDGTAWVHSGDIGQMDEDGFVYFRQRLKRMIITSGYNVYPGQLENILDAHEFVHMSCIIGVPDPYKMQKVKAFVMLKPGIPSNEDTKEAIMAYCRKNIAKYAMPYDIEFRAELPKTLVGKVAYRVLEEEEAKKREAETKETATV